MNTKVKGIVINVKDYKEQDKLATIFTFELGVIFAKFKSVKKENAKMKNACQPFVFCEFELFEKNGFYTVVQSSIINSNFSIAADYKKSVIGFCILEMIDKIVPKQKVEIEIFGLCSYALQELVDSKTYYDIFISFAIKFMILEGEQLTLNLSSPIYLDKYAGDFCPVPNQNCLKIDPKVYEVLKNPDIKTEENIFKVACKLVGLILKIKYDCELISLSLI